MIPHKRYYTEPIEDRPGLYRIVMIWRKPKKRSRIRKIMYWAWHVQSDKQFIHKYFKHEADRPISD